MPQTLSIGVIGGYTLPDAAGVRYVREPGVGLERLHRLEAVATPRKSPVWIVVPGTPATPVLAPRGTIRT